MLWFFQWSCRDVRVGLLRKLSAVELMLLNCGILTAREIQPVHPKGNQSWIFIGRTDVEAEAPILWPPDVKSWFTEKTLMLGKFEGRRRRVDRGLDGWMASLTQWKWIWVNSGSWWWSENPGVLQSMRSQRVGHDWATELNWTELMR